MRSKTILGLITLAGVAGLVALEASVESSFIYFPEKAYAAAPEDYGLRADPLILESALGVRLRGWWIHGEGRTALLFFHGNGGNASHRLERVRPLVDSLGLDVFLVDYRGYGASEGQPSEAGLYADARTIHAAAVARGFPPERIVLFGESLGSAVAVETALRLACRAVILETPFLSIPEMAKRFYPWIPRFLIRTRFDNAAKIGRVRVPKLIVQAEADEVVPPEHARRLFELAPPPKRLLTVPGGHNEVPRAGGTRYLDEWRRFLQEISARDSPHLSL